MKIENQTEVVFANAVALTQNGKLKSTVHCGGNTVFIKNMDNTILLKYTVNQEFPQEFSFYANDYESPKLHVKDGKIIFMTKENGIKRKKECSVPKDSFQDVVKIWGKLEIPKGISVQISDKYLSLLDSNLSHIEIYKENGSNTKFVQRDIYSGTTIEVVEDSSNSLFSMDEDVSFNTKGIRTVDFAALFALVSELTFIFDETKSVIKIENKDINLEGIIATCLYDEIGYIKEV